MPQVFFFDRLSKGVLQLASWSASMGAIIVFEPSSIRDEQLFTEAVSISHVVKYSHDRISYRDELRGPREPVLEVQTMGEDGLRYRAMSAGKRTSVWKEMLAYKTAGVRDTAGAGDWCTAGMLHRLCGRQFADINRITEDQVVEALRFGQAAAAVSCRYEGARGAMYDQTHEQFTDAVSELQDGQDISPEAVGVKDRKLTALFTAICAACNEGSEAHDGVARSEARRRAALRQERTRSSA